MLVMAIWQHSGWRWNLPWSSHTAWVPDVVVIARLFARPNVPVPGTHVHNAIVEAAKAFVTHSCLGSAATVRVISLGKGRPMVLRARCIPLT